MPQIEARELEAVRCLTITQDGQAHVVQLPPSARIVFPFTDDPKLRIEPGDSFEAFGDDDDGLVAIHPENIVASARMGLGGLVLL